MVSDAPLPKVGVEWSLNNFTKILDSPGINGFDIAPKRGQVVHALRLEAILTIEDLRKGADALTLKLSQAEWLEIAGGNKFLTIIFVDRYDDDAISGYWESKECIFYIGNTNYVHECAPNKTEHITKRRD
jgi:hypothetical protein